MLKIPHRESLKVSQKKYCKTHKDKIKEIQSRLYYTYFISFNCGINIS